MAVSLNAGSFGAPKATAGSLRMIYRKRSGKRCSVGYTVRARAVRRTALRRVISRSEGTVMNRHARRSDMRTFRRADLVTHCLPAGDAGSISTNCCETR